MKTQRYAGTKMKDILFDGYFSTMKFTDFMLAMEDLKSKYESEYEGIWVETGHGYHDIYDNEGFPELVIYGIRQQTEAEKEKIEEEDRKRDDFLRQQYEILKKKFEVS